MYENEHAYAHYLMPDNSFGSHIYLEQHYHGGQLNKIPLQNTLQFQGVRNLPRFQNFLTGTVMGAKRG